eukprot:4578600-Prymnesium_polylepis.1
MARVRGRANDTKGPHTSAAPPSPIPEPCIMDPRAVLAPAWCMTSVWDVVRASRTRAMFVCRVLVAR